MPKFSGTQTTAASGSGPIKAKKSGKTVIGHEGATMVERTAKSDLFMLAVTNMVGESNFYEGASERDERFRGLIHKVTRKDPSWVARFVPYLRGTMNMRSAAVVMACEYTRAVLDMKPKERAELSPPAPRDIVSSACARADEPGEVIGYWFSRYGRNLPMPVKRGCADAATRLYNEYTATKYSGSRAIQPADILELCHPKAGSSNQDALFTYLLDVRHGNKVSDLTELPRLSARAELMAVPQDKRRRSISASPAKWADRFKAAGMTWENVSSYVNGEMTARMWEAIIPSMGYMALLRNLRNFDEAGVSDEAAQEVANKIADPAQVARSRQFPYRFFSAYKEAPSLRWANALQRAFEASTGNIPALPGKTLVLIDTSGSMGWEVSSRSTVTHADQAAVFGIATGLRSGAEIVGFASGHFTFEVPKATSSLKAIASFNQRLGEVGHGTELGSALRNTLRADHDRLFVFSDMQATNFSWPKNLPTNCYFVNTAGHRGTFSAPAGRRFVELGGFSDAMFSLIPLIEAGKNCDWPF